MGRERDQGRVRREEPIDSGKRERSGESEKRGTNRQWEEREISPVRRNL